MKKKPWERGTSPDDLMRDSLCKFMFKKPKRTGLPKTNENHIKIPFIKGGPLKPLKIFEMSPQKTKSNEQIFIKEDSPPPDLKNFMVIPDASQIRMQSKPTSQNEPSINAQSMLQSEENSNRTLFREEQQQISSSQQNSRNAFEIMMNNPLRRTSTNQSIIMSSDSSEYILPHQGPFWLPAKEILQLIQTGTLTTAQIIKNISQLYQSIASIKRPDLSTLDAFVTSKDGLKNSDKVNFINNIIPQMAKLALKVESIFIKEVPILKQHENMAIVRLTAEQCACIVAHMFFGTTVKQQNSKISFNHHFYGYYNKNYEKVKCQKLKCIYNYFQRVLLSMPNRDVQFVRLVYQEDGVHGPSDLSTWKYNCAILGDVDIQNFGRIEDTPNAIEIDFANKYLGGAVLTGIQSQEEILFTQSPECLVGPLFCEVMLDNEAILIEGPEKFCKYSGYSSKFKFKEDFRDERKKKSKDQKLLDRQIIAIDALKYSKENESIDELSVQSILRELNKAYLGFIAGDGEKYSEGDRKPIATGRWGCGAFKGNAQLKFIIQWVAASRANRNIIFYTFQDPQLQLLEQIKEKYWRLQLGDLLRDTLAIVKNSTKDNFNLFEQLLSESFIENFVE